MRRLWIISLLLFCFCSNLVTPGFISSYVDEVKKIIDTVFPYICFEHLGCFSSGPPFFNPIWRPVSRLPQEHLKPMFLLYTPTSLEDAFQLHMDDVSVTESTFDPGLPTKILIHGFLVQFELDSFLLKMKNELLKAGKFNVIIVNWEDSNPFPYEQAVANGRKIGAQIAYLLTIMKENRGLNYEDVHLIGHSIGAHIAGWAGERINKIGRITGLDPAGPYFEHAPPEARLDETDATFVDIIHTDAGSLSKGAFGLFQRIGDEDFYPNGGKKQPGCKNESTGLNGLVDKGNICQHSISQYYFIYSINECRFLAVQCESYKKFKKGHCTKENSLVLEMGYRAKKVEGIQGSPTFFLNTTADPPYCAEEDRIGTNSRK